MAVGAQPVYVLCSIWVDNADCQFKYFNFTIQDGSVSNYASWAREGANSNRGSRVDFPVESAIVATRSSLEIIDTSTDRMWMRFLKSGNNAFPNWGSSDKPWTMRFKEGILAVATYTGGGATVIDFNYDTIQNMRTEASSLTGARLRGYTGAQTAPQSPGWNQACGVIRWRNSARGWDGDWNNWQLRNNNVWYVDIALSNGFVYYVACHDDGVDVKKWKRWYQSGTSDNTHPDWPDYAWSNEDSTMEWAVFDPATMDLIYADSDNFYSIGNTNLENRLINFPSRSWDAAHTLARPQPLTQQSQKMCFWFNNSIYCCSSYGVYQVPWPGGPAVMLYSKVGFGGTYSILPDFYSQINAIAYTKDGTNDLVLIDLYDEVRELAQVVAVHLTTHSVYAKTKIVRGGKVAGGLA
jgi:hypothetical protein